MFSGASQLDPVFWCTLLTGWTDDERLWFAANNSTFSHLSHLGPSRLVTTSCWLSVLVRQHSTAMRASWSSSKSTWKKDQATVSELGKGQKRVPDNSETFWLLFLPACVVSIVRGPRRPQTSAWWTKGLVAAFVLPSFRRTAVSFSRTSVSSNGTLGFMRKLHKTPF